MKQNTWILVALIAIVAVAGCYMSGYAMDILGGGNEVQVTISEGLLADAEEMGIEYVDLRIYTSSDSGDVLVHTERLDMVASQSFYVQGIAGMGSVSMRAFLPDGDATDLRDPADSHVEEGDVLVVTFNSSSDPYWSIA